MYQGAVYQGPAYNYADGAIRGGAVHQGPAYNYADGAIRGPYRPFMLANGSIGMKSVLLLKLRVRVMDVYLRNSVFTSRFNVKDGVLANVHMMASERNACLALYLGRVPRPLRC